MPNTFTAQRWVNEYFGAIKRSPVRVVICKGAGAGDLFPIVRLGPVVPEHDQRAGTPNQAIFIFRDDLPLREYRKLLLKLVVDSREECRDRRVPARR
jgi:hypothetical protein